MPDKPKRRKNNKNKRKNKNNIKKTNNDACDNISVNSSECQDENIDDGCEKNQTELDDITKSNISENTNIIEIPNQDVLIDIQHPKTDSEDLSKCNYGCDKNKSEPKYKCEINVAENTNLTENSSPIDVQYPILECENVIKSNNNPSQINVTNINEIQDISNERHVYVVETPDAKKIIKTKLNNGMKSKSVDNDESPSIVEITDEADIQSEDDKSLAIVENTNIIVTDAESDVEWEKMDELHEFEKPENLSAEAHSVTTIPLDIAECKQTQCLSPEQENNLRCYLQSLNLSSSPSNINSLEIKTEIEQIINREIKHRLRKKGFTEDIIFQRSNISRGLDVIDEEGSGESSATSRRHSYLSDKKSDNDELEDEVFENKSVIAFKPTTVTPILKSRQVIPQQCILVDAKLKEPDVSEARGDWSLKTIEKVAGAEVVYLTDSSSSTSSLYDVRDEIENDEISDASIRIITPTIEVTDTEKFLTNTFISKDKDNLNDRKPEFDYVEKVPVKDNEIFSKEEKARNSEKTILIPKENPHEIVVLSTEDIKTNLFVKDVHHMESDIKNNHETGSQTPITKVELQSNLNENILNDTPKLEVDLYDLEIKVLKCELNDAINNLIKEVSDSESTSDNPKDTYARQDSSSSVCSSQCTAKYNPNYSSLNDVSNIMHEENTSALSNNSKHGFQSSDITSHVKEVFQYVTGDSTQNKETINLKVPLALKDLCVKRIASFPYGNKILEELAHVSERLQSMSNLALQSRDDSKLLKENVIARSSSNKHQDKMPYFPLPDLSTIEQVSLSTKVQNDGPPPVQPRNSSLKKTQDEPHWTAVPTTTEAVYVCLSPSQKMLMEKTNTIIKKEDASQLIDTHKKLIDRRGYNEQFKDDIDKTPIVPFKSQTGSRLLALIRDPSVTNNLSYSSNKINNLKSLESLPKINYFDNKEHFDAKNDISNITPHSKSFKPIPPPRPRKFSSSFYESDESSDYTDNSFRSMRSEKKVFHYSTGNLNKDIENDISSIQNMHRYYSKMKDVYNGESSPRRPSLPKDLCDQQMEYIRRKEKEVEEEIQRLEKQKKDHPEKKGPRAPLIVENPKVEKTLHDLNKSISIKKEILFSESKPRQEDKGKLSSAFSKSQEELLRDKMYSEYVSQMAEREQRRQHKFIKITATPATAGAYSISKSMPVLDALDSKVNNRIEKEFICKARERWNKLGIADSDIDDEKECSQDIYREPKVIEHKIKVIQAGEEKDLTNLPSHLQEFVTFTAKTKEQNDSRTGESEPESESAHVVVFCAVIILVLAVGRFVLRLLQNK